MPESVLYRYHYHIYTVLGAFSLAHTVWVFRSGQNALLLLASCALTLVCAINLVLRPIEDEQV